MADTAPALDGDPGERRAGLVGDEEEGEETAAAAIRAATSSAMRSTPGPQATRLSSSLHSGQRRGAGGGRFRRFRRIWCVAR